MDADIVLQPPLRQFRCERFTAQHEMELRIAIDNAIDYLGRALRALDRGQHVVCSDMMQSARDALEG